MAVGDGIYTHGTELVLETDGPSDIADDGFAELTDDNRQATDDPGYPIGLFEFDNDADDPWSGAPTAGAVINIYEQKINSDGADAPDVASTYRYDWIGNWVVAPTDAVQKLSTVCPIHTKGGKYWINWVDGGAGTVALKAGYVVRLIPMTMKSVTS